MQVSQPSKCWLCAMCAVVCMCTRRRCGYGEAGRDEMAGARSGCLMLSSVGRAMGEGE